MKLPNIPQEVWDSRPLLKAIRDEAHRRTAGADAVLWSLLVSVASQIPAWVAIETGMGTPLRPTLYAVLAGNSGHGKSLAWAVAMQILRTECTRQGVRTPQELPLSTGEGLVEAFYDFVPTAVKQTPNAKGEPRPDKIAWVRKRIRHNALFWLDEGEALFQNITKPNSVLGPTIRSFWTGALVGQANANKESRRILEAGTYNGGIVIGVQPKIAGRLLGDTDTGTAQRWVYTSVRDANIPDDEPALVGPTADAPWTREGIQWNPPKLDGFKTVGGLAAYFAQPSPDQPFEPVELPDAEFMVLNAMTSAAMRKEGIRIRRGDEEPDEHNSQRPAMLVKVGAVLAYMDGRRSITEEDCQLAWELLQASEAVRTALVEHAEHQTAQERAERGYERAAVTAAETEADVLRKSCLNRIMAVLADEPDGITRSGLTAKVTTRWRPFLADVLRGLMEAGTIVQTDAAQGGSRYSLNLTKQVSPGQDDASEDYPP